MFLYSHFFVLSSFLNQVMESPNSRVSKTTSQFRSRSFRKCVMCHKSCHHFSSYSPLKTCCQGLCSKRRERLANILRISEKELLTSRGYLCVGCQCCAQSEFHQKCAEFPGDPYGEVPLERGLNKSIILYGITHFEGKCTGNWTALIDHSWSQLCDTS